MMLMAAEVVVLADITQFTLYEISPNVLTAVSILKEITPHKKKTKHQNQPTKKIP